MQLPLNILSNNQFSWVRINKFVMQLQIICLYKRCIKAKQTEILTAERSFFATCTRDFCKFGTLENNDNANTWSMGSNG